MVKETDIFFNEELHRYTDNNNNPYISVTTILGGYENKFDVDYHAARVAKRRGVDIEVVKAEWKAINKAACEKGSKIHCKLENSINDSNGYIKITGDTNDYVKLYTISDILKNHLYGSLDFERFEDSEAISHYPTIRDGIKTLCKQGYHIYSEIVVYDVRSLICGTIDVLLVNWETKEFIILDWKTNNKPISFYAGYFKKNELGYIQDFVKTNKKMKYPFDSLEDSMGNHYTLQLSLYAALLEQFGLRCKALRLCHIYNNKEKSKEEINFYKIKYKKVSIWKMIRLRIDNFKRNK